MVLAVVLLAACRTAAPAPGGPAVTGAATPQLAVEGFIRGVRDGDLQVMSNLWGDGRGATRTWMDQEQHDQRLILMQCLLSHEQSRMISSPTMKADTSVVAVELRKGDLRSETTFKLLRGPASRWYVNMVEPLRSDFCRR